MVELRRPRDEPKVKREPTIEDERARRIQMGSFALVFFVIADVLLARIVLGHGPHSWHDLGDWAGLLVAGAFAVGMVGGILGEIIASWRS